MSIDFSQLKCQKILQTGGKSKYVWLMENDIIKKAYLKKDKRQLNRFRTEIKLLNHLKNCPFVPKILHVDQSNLIIYMTFVGSPLKNTKDNQERLTAKIKELHTNWNLMRHRNGKPNYQVYIGNGTILNGQVYVIDFGSYHYKITGTSK